MALGTGYGQLQVAFRTFKKIGQHIMIAQVVRWTIILGHPGAVAVQINQVGRVLEVSNGQMEYNQIGGSTAGAELLLTSDFALVGTQGDDLAKGKCCGGFTAVLLGIMSVVRQGILHGRRGQHGITAGTGNTQVHGRHFDLDMPTFHALLKRERSIKELQLHQSLLGQPAPIHLLLAIERAKYVTLILGRLLIQLLDYSGL